MNAHKDISESYQRLFTSSSSIAHSSIRFNPCSRLSPINLHSVLIARCHLFSAVSERTGLCICSLLTALTKPSFLLLSSRSLTHSSQLRSPLTDWLSASSIPEVALLPIDEWFLSDFTPSIIFSLGPNHIHIFTTLSGRIIIIYMLFTALRRGRSCCRHQRWSRQSNCTLLLNNCVAALQWWSFPTFLVLYKPEPDPLMNYPIKRLRLP